MGTLKEELKKILKKNDEKPAKNTEKKDFSNNKISHHENKIKSKKNKNKLRNQKYKKIVQKNQPKELPDDVIASAYGVSNVRMSKKSENDLKNLSDEKFRVRVKLGLDASLSLREADFRNRDLIRFHKYDGISESICQKPESNPIELTLGFDFGTSCSKLVIADPQQDKVFAVPFFNMEGLEKYLLPGIVGLSATYLLLRGRELFRDLKLSLKDSEDSKSFFASVAFMALAIRHARAWLFSEYESLYKHSFIYWNFVVGAPSDENLPDGIAEKIKMLASVAWQVSLINLPINNKLIEAVIDNPIFPSNVEIDVCSEIAAQMYGFVSSEHFDPKGNNIFMLVDVGAGTVDTSVFFVSKNDAGRWKFVTYSCLVAFNGSVELHRARLNWLLQFLPEQYDSIASSIENELKKTDCLVLIPNNMSDYVSDMSLSFANDNDAPDYVFRKNRLSRQIYNVYHSAWKESGIKREQLRKLPTFYCGGGMGMQFYREIPNLLDRAVENYSWIHPEPRKLVVPSKLVAPGLRTDDYNRISVAYGLALLRKGEHITVNKVAPVDIQNTSVGSDYILYPK